MEFKNKNGKKNNVKNYIKNLQKSAKIVDFCTFIMYNSQVRKCLTSVNFTKVCICGDFETMFMAYF